MSEEIGSGGAPFGDEFTLVLRKPIALGSETYVEIQLSEPTAKELREADTAGSAMAQIMKLISLNGKVPHAVVDRMLQRDVQRAADFFAHFSASQAP